MTAGVMGTLYIGRLSAPLGDPSRPCMSATFYVGWTDGDPAERWRTHEAGRGARMIAAAVARGIAVEWRILGAGTRDDERRLKRNGHYVKLWPRAIGPDAVSGDRDRPGA